MSSTASSDSSSASAFNRLFQKLSPKHNSTKSLSSTSLLISKDNIISSPAVTAVQVDRKSFDGELIGRVFNYFDEDGDGRISALELQNCMKAVGGRELSLAEAEVGVESSDSDGDGMLDLEEFGKLLEGGDGESKEEELRGAFGMYTAEGSSEITAKSLKRMLSRLGQSTSVDNCKAMIRKFDLNGDGVLNFDEFRIMMCC